MKLLLSVACVVGLLVIAGCSDTADVAVGNNGNNGGGGNAANLQSLVLNNCNRSPGGDPRMINGASFPASSTTDPAQSVYTQNCLGG